MLVVTELAEAVEADRAHDDLNYREEIADAVIRLFDLCGADRIDLESEIAAKMEVNEARANRHGKRY
jgi:NTP pyrophosphatase (non-canonical NTP hydrolase)